MTKINTKNVGDIVLIDDEGKAGSEYIVVHKGLPSSNYDSSCDGVWLMRKNAITARQFDSDDNNYGESSLRLYITVNYYYNSGAYNILKSVYVPYYSGTGTNGTLMKLKDGTLVHSFVLSGTEVGFTTSNNSNLIAIGTVLDYFKNGGSKICYNDSGTAVDWWLRTPVKNSDTNVFCVSASGGLSTAACSNKLCWRPVIVVSGDCRVDSNNFLQSANTKPVITSNKTGNLGTLTNGFTCNYSVTDADSSDPLTVTLMMDNTNITSFSAVRGKQETYTLGGTDWLKIANGTHTFKISAYDGKETVESTATFTRNCNSLTVSLSPALTTKKLMTAFNLQIFGDIPSDAEIVCEACNNGKDDSPAWEDITARVRSGLTYVFKNKTAKKGYAVNFRVTVTRGSSGKGGFIEKIICAYE